MAKSGKRFDSKHRLLRQGEGERADGYYIYRWTAKMESDIVSLLGV